MASAIRTLRTSDSLDTIWEELVYTEAKLKARKDTKALAAPYTALLSEWKKVRDERYAHWRAEVIADAGVDLANEDLDDTVLSIDNELQHVVARDTASPRYTRYFASAPNRVVRQALEAQLHTVDGWAVSLQSEKEAPLKSLGKLLAKVVKAGHAALGERTGAAGGRADHFARDLTAFVAKVNDQREATLASLIEIGGKLGKSPASDWAARFFRKASRGAPADTAATPAAPAEAPTS